MNRQSATINGCRVGYALEGEANRPVLVLSHALATSMEIWGFQLPILRPKFRVLLYDVRGHGGSEPCGDSYTLEELASDVVLLLDYLEIPRATFVGLSLGGMIGQAVALGYPERLSGLVLCSTGSQMEQAGKATLQERITSVLSRGLESQVEATLRRWFSPDFILNAPGTVAWISDLIRSTSIAGFTGCCRAIQGLDFTERLTAVRLPTLLVPGELDQSFPVAVSERIQRQIAGSEVVPLSGAAHLGNIERAHAFNEIVLRFLNRMLP